MAGIASTMPVPRALSRKARAATRRFSSSRLKDLRTRRPIGKPGSIDRCGALDINRSAKQKGDRRGER
ncbi:MULTISPECIES: hypothetical protein [Burkholderia]|uniref:hypothetical protein n=1 Tax=Burkholderia TaxID=32008 RepID=UPI000F52D708|nr:MULTISPECIES: hypothetical protein [Burkholderia]NBI48224.1 hypothetical protein [Burkholderia sp. ISTR5]